MKCVIIASGDLEYTEQMAGLIRNCPLIICADGGARHLRRLKITPHVLIGDFDSISPDDKSFLLGKKIEIYTHPPHKDKTDSELCVAYALKKKASDITLLGVTGTRMDHTLANIFLLKELSLQEIPARIINKTNEIHIVTSKITLKGNPGEYLSLIPVCEKVCGITLEGLTYPLENATIEMGSSLGVSNSFKNRTATIRIKCGILVVTKSKDRQDCLPGSTQIELEAQ